jgi:hypothetical protein
LDVVEMKTLRMIGLALLCMLGGMVVAAILLTVAFGLMCVTLACCLASMVEQKAKEVERYPCTETRDPDDEPYVYGADIRV